MNEPQVMDLLHDSVLTRVVDACDLRTRMAVLCTCWRLRHMCERPELWRRISFESADEQRGLKAEWLLGVLSRAHGGVEVLHLARSREARAAEREQRFSNGLKFGQMLPHTQGPAALQLTALCPRLVHLSIDERASCLGGMTNCLARALGAHCPALETLEVYFDRYSLPSELLTDEGVIALSEGCRRLRTLALVNCDHVGDRSLYAVAANCRGLRELQLGGYSENITDCGMCVLVESCTALSVLWLGAKLLKVTDATATAAARHCGPALRRVKLTRSMGPAAVAALAAGCPGLRELDARHARGGVAEESLAALTRACSRLTRIVLPPQLPLLADGSATLGTTAPRVYTVTAAGSGAASAGVGGGAVSGAVVAVAPADEDDEEDSGAIASAAFGTGGGVLRLAAPGSSGGGCAVTSVRMLQEAELRRLQGGIGATH